MKDDWSGRRHEVKEKTQETAMNIQEQDEDKAVVDRIQQRFAFQSW